MFIDAPPPIDYNYFDSITIEAEYRQIMPPNIELINYFLTEFPGLGFQTENNQFVSTLFEESDFAYNTNSFTVLKLANQIFSGSRELTSFEEDVLNYTFTRLLKNKPTRPNRL